MAKHRFRVVGILIVGALIAFAGWKARDWQENAPVAPPAEEAKHSHAGDGNQIPLSDQARRNIGLTVGEVQLSDYWKTLSVPGVLVEQPGRSELRVTTAVNGIVLRVHAFPGQAVRPGDPLFDVQLTGELLATTQSSLLRTLQDLELNAVEQKRIAPLVEAGTLSAKTKLELDYERRRLESSRDVLTQELLVRGLSPAQIDGIVQTKKLLREFTVVTPGTKPLVDKTAAIAKEPPSTSDVVYAIEKIDVYPGKLVKPGDELCDLAFHSTLWIEGQAFEKEGDVVNRAVQERLPVEAIFESGGAKPRVLQSLQVLHVDNSVQLPSRTIKFFLPLSNEIVRDNKGLDGATYRTWLFKPGQKLTLRLPVEQFKERIVLPAEAVVKEGLEAFVFQVNGEMMERKPVNVEYQDSRTVVLANDGSIFPGDSIAMNNAYQLNLAMRKAAGSGADPHAGHDHSH